MAYYVTTPIYYVNAEPHLGHAYTTIAADILARHMRQRGEDVFFLTGTDEHGEPVAHAAEKLGVEPRALADQNSARFLDMAARVNATNDFFIRTSDPRHESRVQEVLQQVHDNGFVYRGTYEGWYCPRCADFKTDADLAEGNRCPIHRIELEREKEDNWFFRLSAFQDRLEQLYSDRPDFVLPRIRFNEAHSFIKGGLNDVSLTRARLRWGVPVPWDEDQVFYVWFDALLNYYTALAFAREGDDVTDRYWPCRVHLIGKDILKFHAVFWPALLMAAGIAVPERVFIHGYLLMDEHKMSKSLGNVIDPFRIIDLYGTDALRYYLFREVSFGQDGNVSTEGFEARYTSELANEYGNLASRTLAMVARYRDGEVAGTGGHGTDLPGGEHGTDLPGGEHGTDLPGRVARRFDEVDVSGALEEIWKDVRRLNQYVQEERPWELAKAGEDQRLDAVLARLVEGLRVVSRELVPFIPESAGKLLEVLGRDRLEPIEPLFPRVEAQA